MKNRSRQAQALLLTASNNLRRLLAPAPVIRRPRLSHSASAKHISKGLLCGVCGDPRSDYSSKICVHCYRDQAAAKFAEKCRLREWKIESAKTILKKFTGKDEPQK